MSTVNKICYSKCLVLARGYLQPILQPTSVKPIMENIRKFLNLEVVLSVFFAPTRYRVIKIASSSFAVVLRTMKYTVIYPGSCPSSDVTVVRPGV
jgi:hypothetical protein